MSASVQVTRMIEVAKIEVGHRLRPLSDTKVKAFAESIERQGLLQPIIVHADTFKLIAGYHRLEAVRLLGWSTVAATLMRADQVEAELAEIDENLVRNELTALERSEHLAKRKALYEAKHPEAKHGGAPGLPGGGKAKNDNMSSFADDTAAKTGRSARAIQRDVRIAEQLTDEERNAVRGTPIEKRQRDLLLLADAEPEERAELIEEVKSGKAKSVHEAVKSRSQSESDAPESRPKRRDSAQRTAEDAIEFDAEVRRLSEEGYGVKATASKLGADYEHVRESRSRQGIRAKSAATDHLLLQVRSMTTAFVALVNSSDFGGYDADFRAAAIAKIRELRSSALKLQRALEAEEEEDSK